MKEHPKFYMLFNHTLSTKQEADAREHFGVNAFVQMPDAIKKIWSEIPAEDESLHLSLAPVWQYLDRLEAGDVVLIQGDFGASYLAVQYVKDKDAIAVYATTKRHAIEKKVGNKMLKTSVFEHVRYRVYGQ